METGVTYLLLVVLLQLVSGDTYDGFQPRYYNRGERRLGKVILYRTTGSTRYPTPEASLLRDTHPSRRYPHDSRNDRRYFQERSDHGSRYRIRFGTDAEPERKYIERRTGKGHPENYKTDSSIQQHRYRQERTPNGINEYLDRFNYDYFNTNDAFHVPFNNFYDQALGLQFRPGLTNNFETFVATGPGNHRHVIRVPPLKDQDTQLQEHKYMTRAQFTRDREPLVTYKGPHRFSTGNRAPTIQEYHEHFYKGVPVFEQQNLGGKEYDPRFLAIYRSIVEAYKKQIQDSPQSEENFLQKSNNYQTNKNIPNSEDNIFQNFIEKYKNLNTGISTQLEHQVPHNGLILGQVKEPSYRSPPFGDKTERFRPSPPVYRYSEPDPLYHPNHSPLQTHNPALLGRTETTKPTAPSKSTTTTTTVPPSTEKVIKFPDSINAQLPPPGDDEDTRIPYVAATVVTPQTTANDQTTPIDMVTDINRNVHSVLTTTRPILSITSNKIAPRENSSAIFQKHSGAIPQFIIPKITVSHEVPLLNASVIFITVEEVTTTKPLTPSSPEINIPNEIPVENTIATSTSGYTASGSEKIATLMQDNLHFQPTVFTEATPHLRRTITVPKAMYGTTIYSENSSTTEDTSNMDDNVTQSSMYEVSATINDTFETTTTFMTQSPVEGTISSQGDSDEKLIIALQEEEAEVNTDQETTTVSGVQSKANNNQQVSFSQEQNTFMKYEIGKSTPPAMNDMDSFPEQEPSVESSEIAIGHENKSTIIPGGNNMVQFKKPISTPEVSSGRQYEKSPEDDVRSNEESSYSSTLETEDISKVTE